MKKYFLLFVAGMLLLSSCKDTLCEKGIYPFCEEENEIPKTGVVEKRTNAPVGWNITSFSIGQKGYFGGGTDELPIFGKKEFYSYDSSTDQWEPIASNPQGRFSGVGFSILNKGYVGGGYDANMGESGPEEIQLKDFWEFDPATNRWSQKADLPGGEGKYIGFGILDRGYVLKDYKFWEYNPSLNKWNAKADCPVETGVVFSVGLFGYVLYGRHLWEYNSLTNKWSEKAQYPGESGISFSTTRKGYVVGTINIYEYNPLSNKWLQKVQTPDIKDANTNGVSLRLQGAFGIGDEGYFGLHYRSSSYSFYKFDPNSN